MIFLLFGCVRSILERGSKATAIVVVLHGLSIPCFPWRSLHSLCTDARRPARARPLHLGSLQEAWCDAFDERSLCTEQPPLALSQGLPLSPSQALPRGAEPHRGSTAARGVACAPIRPPRTCRAAAAHLPRAPAAPQQRARREWHLRVFNYATGSGFDATESTNLDLRINWLARERPKKTQIRLLLQSLPTMGAPGQK